mgnify:CR=1 FL=1
MTWHPGRGAGVGDGGGDQRRKAGGVDLGLHLPQVVLEADLQAERSGRTALRGDHGLKIEGVLVGQVVHDHGQHVARPSGTQAANAVEHPEELVVSRSVEKARLAAAEAIQQVGIELPVHDRLGGGPQALTVAGGRRQGEFRHIHAAPILGRPGQERFGKHRPGDVIVQLPALGHGLGEGDPLTGAHGLQIRSSAGGPSKAKG